MRRPSLTPEAYRNITRLAVFALCFIIVTGAAVRLTGSGLGCETWPNCEDDSLFPRDARDGHAMVEFVNRLITGFVSIAVILAVLGSVFRVPRRRDLTWWSVGLVAGVAAQAVLGGIVVLLHLSPVSVMGHFLLSMVLVWNALVLHRRAGEPAPGRSRRRPSATPEVVALSRLLLVASVLVLLTGTVVTASGPHGGDERADRLDLFVPDVARIHGISVVLFGLGAVLLVLMVRRGAGGPRVVRRGDLLLGAIGAQAAVGYTQYFTGVPVILVGIHVAGAVTVWSAMVWFHLGLHDRVAESSPRAEVAPPDLADLTT